MTTRTTITIFVAMNEDGAWVMSDDEDAAHEQFEEEHGEDSGCSPRIVKLNVTMAPPIVTEADEAPPVVTEVDVMVPDDTGQT
jgi:hypothetical protein